MFERLTEAFGNVYRRLSGRGQITESNVREAVEDVRRALLEADVHVEVVNAFIDEVLQDALGRQVTRTLRPGEEMIGIVYRRLVELLGGRFTGERDAAGMPVVESPPAGIARVSPPPTIVMLCGLQGSGKTTTAGKLAAYLKKRGRSVMLAAADLQRPAAIEQLETVARRVREELGGTPPVEFYAEPDKVAAYGEAVGVAVGVCQRAVQTAARQGLDTVILDTAGRLHVDDALMDELETIRQVVRPHEVLLVVDAMTGQDAARSARAFHERVGVDGVILAKADADARGGATMSVRRVTGVPIRFVGVGERLDALEEFHPQRMAGRILGMGDIVSLVERAREQVSQGEAQRLSERLARGEMTLDDFLAQLKALRRMGPLRQLLSLIPGLGAALKDAQIDERQLTRIEAIINSMTPRERAQPQIIDHSRRKRIAAGSGTRVEDVAALVRQFQALRTLGRQMAGLSAAERIRAAREVARGDLGGLVPGLSSLPGLTPPRKGTYTPGPRARFKKRRR